MPASAGTTEEGENLYEGVPRARGVQPDRSLSELMVSGATEKGPATTRVSNLPYRYLPYRSMYRTSRACRPRRTCCRSRCSRSTGRSPHRASTGSRARGRGRSRSCRCSWISWISWILRICSRRRTVQCWSAEASWMESKRLRRMRMRLNEDVRAGRCRRLAFTRIVRCGGDDDGRNQGGPGLLATLYDSRTISGVMMYVALPPSEAGHELRRLTPTRTGRPSSQGSQGPSGLSISPNGVSSGRPCRLSQTRTPLCLEHRDRSALQLMRATDQRSRRRDTHVGRLLKADNKTGLWKAL